MSPSTSVSQVGSVLVSRLGIARIARAGVAWLWPARCAACDALVPDDVAFCGRCAEFVEACATACTGCAMPLGTQAGMGIDLAHARCPRCCGEPLFARAASALLYGGTAAQAILRFKNGRYDLARPLGRLLAPALARVLSADAQAIVPVPIHAAKLRRRGFAAPAMLARVARRALRSQGVPVPALAPTALVRRTNGGDLRAASVAERSRRVAGAFAVNPRAGAALAGARLVLVDDVLTSGATLAECARVLEAAGARVLGVATLARTP